VKRLKRSKFFSIILILVLFFNGLPAFAYTWDEQKYMQDPVYVGTNTLEQLLQGDKLFQQKLLEACLGDQAAFQVAKNAISTGDVLDDQPAPSELENLTFKTGFIGEKTSVKISGLYGSIVPKNGAIKINGKSYKLFIPIYRLVNGIRNLSCHNIALALFFSSVPYEPNTPTGNGGSEVLSIICNYIKNITTTTVTTNVYNNNASRDANYGQVKDFNSSTNYGSSISGGGVTIYTLPGAEISKEKSPVPSVTPGPSPVCTVPTGPATVPTPFQVPTPKPGVKTE
jgi:hypothetical protein